MDVVSHALWGVALFRGRVRWQAAAAAGALPDLVAFLPAVAREVARGDVNYLHQVRPVADYPGVTMHLYNVTHSLAGLATVGLCTWLVLRRRPRLARGLRAPGAAGSSSAAAVTAWLLGPWALHLAIDAPLHTLDFFPTPLLWPFSERVVAGIPWAQPAVWLPNLALLALALWCTWPRAAEARARAPSRR